MPTFLLGDGASSEGEFWESLNYACGRKLPVLYVVQDNGYAISVPVDVQTAGGKISGLVRELSPSADARMRRHGFSRKLRSGGARRLNTFGSEKGRR